MTDAISFVHSAFMPPLKRGVPILLGVALLNGGNTPFVLFVDH
jgi:hypothetical protein